MAINEEVSLFEEIDEELKNDRMYALLKKHKNTAISIFVALIIAAVGYSSWRMNKKQRLESITTALVDVLRNPSNEKSAELIESLMEEAPAEMRPLLILLKSGRQLQISKAVEDNAKELLALSQKKGVDIVWKDLATLVLASHNAIQGQKIPEILEELTAENRPFKFMAMELLAIYYFNEKQIENATKYFQKILDHRDASDTLKERISMILNHIKNKSEE